MMKKKKYLLIGLMLSLLMIGVVGCNAKDDVKKPINGGDLIKYSFCLKEGKEQLATCPIIMTEKAKEITLNNFVADDKGALSVVLNSVDLNDFVEYEGYYVYFPVLKIACLENERSVDTSIEKLIFEVDGKIVEYVTPDFNIKNIRYFVESGECESEGSNILISGEFTAIYGYVPDEERMADLVLESDQAILLKSYGVLDYMEIDNLTINGSTYANDEIGLYVESKVDTELKYTLDLKESVSEDNIIRSSQIILYECEGQDYVWVYTPGIYVWKDYTDYSNVIRFIENAI